jgi:hypothetical protein
VTRLNSKPPKAPRGLMASVSHLSTELTFEKIDGI